MDELEAYKKALQRERQARTQAEQLLEDKARELYLLNSELKKANKQIQSHQRKMIKTEKLVSLGTLAAGVAHEINNPLAFIKSNVNTLERYVQALVDGSADKPQQDVQFIQEDCAELFPELKDGIQRVQDIVADLKSFSRSKSSDIAEADANEAVQAAIRITNGQIKYDCKVETDLSELPSIHCNISELSQVFINMLMNGADATGDGGEITIKSWCQDDSIYFTVCDNGSGIPEKYLDNIFTPFFTSKPVGKGTGLGLSVSHGIIEDLGGSIQVESEEGKGSCFTITIPVQENQEVKT